MKDNDDSGERKQLHDSKWRHMIQALHETLNMLGEPSKGAILHALEYDYKINFSESECSPPEQIESALQDMFGPGAEIIIKEWKEKLD
jgi:hypothetical protein